MFGLEKTSQMQMLRLEVFEVRVKSSLLYSYTAYKGKTFSMIENIAGPWYIAGPAIELVVLLEPPLRDNLMTVD